MMKEIKLHGELIVTGSNSLEYITKLNTSKVIIITGEGSTFKYGTIDKMKQLLENAGIKYCVYSGIKQNPTTKEVMDGLSVMRDFNPDSVIAVGGGSAIDAAKVMTLFYDYPDLDFEKVKTGEIPEYRKSTKFIAIPTTSGTGTEVTKSAVITYESENIKLGLRSKAFIPDIAILDPKLTLTMPAHIAAETGMDAMTHAVECYINKNLDDFTECLASGAIEGLFKYLPLSYLKGDIESRQKVHNYQCMAGSAFANVGLGMAHGIAHSIGGMYNLGHGLINAVVLPYVLKFNSKDTEVKNKLKYLAKRIEKDDFIQAVVELNEILGIPKGFTNMGISREVFDRDLEVLTENSLKGSTRVNPVSISKEEMKQLLTDIYRN